MILHGIPNCDTMKKARLWLDARGVAYAFHDYRKQGVDAALLRAWVAKIGWEALLNRNGTTFRKLPEGERRDVDEARAIALMVAQPGMIRRPVLVDAERIVVGFSPERYAAHFETR